MRSTSLAMRQGIRQKGKTGKSYRIRLRYAVPDITPEKLTSLAAEVRRVRRLQSPTAEIVVPPYGMEFAATVRADGPIRAADAALRGFRDAVQAAGLAKVQDPYLREMSVEPVSEHDLKRSEVVSAAEVGRRLGVSRERVRQLAEEPGRFPYAIANIRGSRAWRWGDIADWVAAGSRKPRGRPKLPK